MPEFEIPPEYQHNLEVARVCDQRSNDEILQTLNQHIPVTSEKNIWAFWHNGIFNMPGWCQRNVADWARICGSDWTIRILDNIPESANYALKYVHQDLLPQTFIKRTMDGPFIGQHSADLVRGATLVQHGGVWMDVGCLLTRDLDRVCWNRIQDPNDPYQVAAIVRPNHGIINYFMASRKRDPFIEIWHHMFCSLWKDRTNLLGISDHPLLSFTKRVPAEQFAAAENDTGMNMKGSLINMVEYAAQIYIWTRLTLLEADAANAFSGASYWRKSVMRIDFNETLGAECVLGYNIGGQSTLAILNTRLDADKSSEEYKQAYKVIWFILSECSMQKIYRGGNVFAAVQLGTLLDLPENEGKDCEPGTFAELLRYGSVHFCQKRHEITVRDPEAPEAKTAQIFKDYLTPV
ncbi:putative glycosyl transferase FCK3 [Paramyrothecium foliicola]|nr:putative glycosyl transferase FCK3 [Paramyrothecium foliicola]